MKNIIFLLFVLSLEFSDVLVNLVQAENSKELHKIISQEISNIGAKSTLNIILKDGRWEKVLDGISSANKDWLEIAIALRPFTDGVASEEIDISFGLALNIRPASVLLLVNDKDWLASICGAEPIDESRPLNLDVLFYSQREKALRSIRSASLLEKRNICLDKVISIQKLLMQK